MKYEGIPEFILEYLCFNDKTNSFCENLNGGSISMCQKGTHLFQVDNRFKLCVLCGKVE